jgi:bifunctional oligoribonuclease and PAP phosphatase NrnA
MFRTLIESTQCILITTHINPDPDAIGSILCVYGVLNQAYPEKEIVMSVEGTPGEFASRFLYRDKILSQELSKSLDQYQPDCIICTDASYYKRFTNNPESWIEYNTTHQPALIGIDHHLSTDEEAPHWTWYKNTLASSCSEEIVSLLLEEEYTLNAEVLLPALVGMVADTNRFLYPNTNWAQTAHILEFMQQKGLTVQEAQACLETITFAQTRILSHMLSNLAVTNTSGFPRYMLSFLTDEEVIRLRQTCANETEFSSGIRMGLRYLVGTDGMHVGVAVYKDPERAGVYKGSFRSDNTVDSSIYSQALGGGGHTGASGFEIQCDTLEEAIEIVKNVITITPIHDNKQ